MEKLKQFFLILATFLSDPWQGLKKGMETITPTRLQQMWYKLYSQQRKDTQSDSKSFEGKEPYESNKPSVSVLQEEMPITSIPGSESVKVEPIKIETLAKEHSNTIQPYKDRQNKIIAVELQSSELHPIPVATLSVDGQGKEDFMKMLSLVQQFDGKKEKPLKPIEIVSGMSEKSDDEKQTTWASIFRRLDLPFTINEEQIKTIQAQKDTLYKENSDGTLSITYKDKKNKAEVSTNAGKFELLSAADLEPVAVQEGSGPKIVVIESIGKVIPEHSPSLDIFSANPEGWARYMVDVMFLMGLPKNNDMVVQVASNFSGNEGGPANRYIRSYLVPGTFVQGESVAWATIAATLMRYYLSKVGNGYRYPYFYYAPKPKVESELAISEDQLNDFVDQMLLIPNINQPRDIKEICNDIKYKVTSDQIWKKAYGKTLEIAPSEDPIAVVEDAPAYNSMMEDKEKRKSAENFIKILLKNYAKLFWESLKKEEKNLRDKEKDSLLAQLKLSEGINLIPSTLGIKVSSAGYIEKPSKDYATEVVFSFEFENKLRGQLSSLSKFASQNKGKEYDALKDVRVCMHYNAPVTIGTAIKSKATDLSERDESIKGFLIPRSNNQKVNLVLCSTFQDPDSDVIDLTKALLKRMYYNTLLAAKKAGKKKVLLTLIGGGVFKNPLSLISEAMDFALQKAHEKKLDIEIIVNLYSFAYDSSTTSQDRNALRSMLYKHTQKTDSFYGLCTPEGFYELAKADKKNVSKNAQDYFKNHVADMGALLKTLQ